MSEKPIQMRGKMRDDGVLELTEDDLIKAGWVKARKKEYYQKPEVKAKKKEYLQKHKKVLK